MLLYKKNKLKIVPQIIILILFLASCSDKAKIEKIDQVKTQIEYDRFGFPVDSFLVVRGEVNKNETLADILIPNNINYQTITEIYNSSKPIFDFRKIQPKKKYRFYFNLDSTQSIYSFVYEINKIEFLIVNFTDSLKINLIKRETEVLENSVSGTIYSSLYQTFIDNNSSQLLAGKLAEVFAWQIDFYTIQKGDSFFAIYEEEKVGKDIVGLGDIIAAKFIHKNNEYSAFLFNQNGKLDYFDENGGSLQKAFLKAPLKFKRISSSFSRSRLHPISRIYKPHLGIDYAAAIGTPVQSVGDGIVLEARRNGGAGNYVKIKHNSFYSSGYMHLSKYGKGIKSGVKVNQGQIIGYVGSTGTATGPHLDFRFWKNGSLVNYLNQKFPSSKSVAKEYLNEFTIIKDSLNIKINNLMKINTQFNQEHEQGKTL